MIKLIEVIDELEMGGAQHVVYQLISHLDKTKFDVTIICLKKARPFASMLEQQIRQEGYRIVYLTAKKKKWKYFQLGWQILKLKPNIIHAHQTGVVAAAWGTLLRIKTVVTIHTSPWRAFIFRTPIRVFRATRKFHSVITVAISEYNKKICQEYWKLQDKDIYFVNNGIDISNCIPISHDNFSFINVGRQDENKNQILIIKAFAKFLEKKREKNFLLYLVGDGDKQHYLKKNVELLGISDKVVFTGYISNPKSYLGIADVYISSSHREGLSLSVLEAMAFGIPVIATDAGGVRDLARENGFLISDDDEKAMIEAMEFLYKNPLICKKMGKKSLEMVQQYTVEKMAEGYEKIFEKFARK